MYLKQYKSQVVSFQPLIRKSNKTGSEGFRKLNYQIMTSKYATIMKLLSSVFSMPYRDDSKRESFRKLLKKEVLAKRDGTLLYREMETFVSWVKRNYLDNDAKTANFEYWAADGINFKSIYATTSQSESHNAQLKKALNKKGTRVNAVKKLAAIQMSAFENKSYMDLHCLKTKRKKRRTLVTTIIVANCHRQLKSLEMTNDDCRSLSKTALHMMKKLLLLIADARFKAKIICQGEESMFLDWVRAHVDQFPQDRPLLSDFIRSD